MFGVDRCHPRAHHRPPPRLRSRRVGGAEARGAVERSPVGGRHLVRIRYLEPLHPPYGSGVRRDVVRSLAERVRETLVDELARMRAERA